MLNVFDLTHRSHNARLLRSGKAEVAMEDLESQVVPDSGLKETDIALIEKEVNKKKQKRFKAQRDGQMISPQLTTSNRDLDRVNVGRPEDALY